MTSFEKQLLLDGTVPEAKGARLQVRTTPLEEVSRVHRFQTTADAHKGYGVEPDGSKLDSLSARLLGVPIQVVAPAFRYLPETQCDPQSGKEHRSLRCPNELKSYFHRSTVSFSAVAFDAARNDVLPNLSASLGSRHDMVESQLRAR